MALNYDDELFYELLAVSVSPDPLGEYYCYIFQFEDINDYPKICIWPDGYYISYNIFTPNWMYMHPLVTVIDMEAMLAGEPEVTMLQFEIPEQPSMYVFRMCPLAADFKGTLLPEINKGSARKMVKLIKN